VEGDGFRFPSGAVFLAETDFNDETVAAVRELGLAPVNGGGAVCLSGTVLRDVTGG
jgi:hypothetical protein